MDLSRSRNTANHQDTNVFSDTASEGKLPYHRQLSYLPTTHHPYDSSIASQSRQRERVVVCIDGSNLFYAATNLNLEIDYYKLLQQVTAGRSLLRAYFYTGVDPENEKQQGFLLWMRRNGYRVVTRDLVSLPNGAKSANLDVEIAVDMMQLADHCDTIVLFSGDGDLAYAVEQASYKGTRFEIVSLRSMTSEALLNVADEYTDLADLATYICKSPRHYSSDPGRKPILATPNYPIERAIA